MIVSMDLELKDIPGQLVQALIPIYESGGNIMSVIHHHDQRTSRGTIPVQVVFQLSNDRLNHIIDKLESKEMRVVSVDEKRLHEEITVIIIGHIVHSDMSDTIDQIDNTGFAEVVKLSISMPGIEDPSSSSLVINAVSKEKLTEALNILKNIAKEKNLLVIEPIEKGFL